MTLLALLVLMLQILFTNSVFSLHQQWYQAVYVSSEVLIGAHLFGGRVNHTVVGNVKELY